MDPVDFLLLLLIIDGCNPFPIQLLVSAAKIVEAKNNWTFAACSLFHLHHSCEELAFLLPADLA